MADFTEDFEAYSAGSEIAAQSSDWTENPSSSNIFMVVSSPVNNGSRALHVDNDGSSVALEYAFTSEGTQVSITFYVRSNDVSGNTPRFGIGTGIGVGEQGPYIRISGSDFQNYDGSSWQDITTGNVLLDDTWYKIKIVASLSSDTFEFYLGDVKQGTTHDFRDDQAALDTFILVCGGSSSGDDLYIDDIEGTLGVGGVIKLRTLSLMGAGR